MATLSTFFDMVYVYATETSGHGPFTLGSAVTGFQTAAAAGVSNGTPVSYRATDGINWETAHGVVDVSGGVYTLTRGVDTIKSSNSNALVNFGSGVTVVITPISQDINALLSTGAAQSFSASQQSQGRTNIGAGVPPHGSNPGSYMSPNPYSTTSDYPTFVMAGCGFSYTPSGSGLVAVLINGGGYNNSANGQSIFIMQYGTGTAPATGAALTGTTFGQAISTYGVWPNAIFGAGTLTLMVGTTYWFDPAMCQNVGGASAALLANPGCIVLEL